MFKKAMLLTGATLLASCASRPAEPPPPPSPPPVEIAESAPVEAPTTPVAEAPAEAPATAKPSQTESGRFRISIASVDSMEVAAPWVKKAEAAGYRTEIQAVEIDGKTWQRVLLPGYASLADAQAALPFIQQELGAPNAWVTSRRRAPAPAVDPGVPPPPPPAEKPAN